MWQMPNFQNKAEEGGREDWAGGGGGGGNFHFYIQAAIRQPLPSDLAVFRLFHLILFLVLLLFGPIFSESVISSLHPLPKPCSAAIKVNVHL